MGGKEKIKQQSILLTKEVGKNKSKKWSKRKLEKIVLKGDIKRN